MFGTKQPKCVVVDAPCPRNSDPERGSYCPHWAPLTRRNNATQEETHYQGCDIPVHREQQRDLMRAGWISSKFVNLMSNSVVKVDNKDSRRIDHLELKLDQVRETLRQLGLAVFALTPDNDRKALPHDEKDEAA